MDDGKIKVSIIVPVYNVETYLPKCIESILTQSYSNLEIILVDDGSEDTSGKICERFAKEDLRIPVIHKENGGLSDARNAGLEVATGNYYMFIDSDDYLSSDATETLLVAAKKNKCEISVCNMIRFSEDGKESDFYVPVHEETVYRGNERYATLNQPSVCNKMFKAELFDDVRFPKGKFYEDTFVYHRLVYKAESIVLTGKNSYWYLLRQGSILGRPQYTNRYFDFIEAVYCRAKFLVENNVQPYGNEACLSLYAALSNAEKHIIKTAENAGCFRLAHEQYKFAYNTLMKVGTDCGIKQKLRLLLLNYMPKIHSRLY